MNSTVTKLSFTLAIIYSIGAFLVLVADYTQHTGANKDHVFWRIAFYEPATEIQKLALSLNCKLDFDSGTFDYECIEDSGYRVIHYPYESLYKKKPSFKYFLLYVVLIPSIVLASWLSVLKMIFKIKMKISNKTSETTLFKNWVNKYSSINNRQRNILRIVALLCCIVGGPITLILVTPWLLPLMLYLEYHVEPKEKGA